MIHGGRWSAPGGLYFRYASALHDADTHSCQSGEGVQYSELLGAITNIRDEEMEQLHAELAQARARLARIDAALDVLEGYGGPDTHDAYLQIRRASTTTCEQCGKHLPGPTESGWWFCDPCLDKDRKRRWTYTLH